jgi:hypothetical protein
MNKAIPILLFIVGVINFLPVVGVLSAEKLSQAYAVDLVNNNLVILMRHRALLFGVVGGFILYSVFVPSYQGVAMVMAAITMLGYLYFVWAVGGYNDSIFRVAMVDVVGLVCLALAAALKAVSASS